jgi:hypothetical protein
MEIDMAQETQPAATPVKSASGATGPLSGSAPPSPRASVASAAIGNPAVAAGVARLATVIASANALQDAGAAHTKALAAAAQGLLTTEAIQAATTQNAAFGAKLQTASAAAAAKLAGADAKAAAAKTAFSAIGAALPSTQASKGG